METPAKKIVSDPKQFTTFVQADTETFKDVVQRLTGSSEAAHEVTTAKGNIGIKKPEFKLHERRQYKAKLEIIKPPLRVVRTSPMNTPTKCFSNLSLVERESRGEASAPDLDTQEEEKAIRERRFYLHPSPRSKPGFNEPELLSLFPLTSHQTGEESKIFQKE